jgi:hypothetical protein
VREHTLTIRADGTLEFIYSDDLAAFMERGGTVVTRASHVEPYKGGWTADMRPSGGPILGANGASIAAVTTLDGALTVDCLDTLNGQVVNMSGPFPALQPFKTRAEALAAEVAWLKERRGL